MSVVVVMLVKEECADDVEKEADTADDEDKLRVLDALNGDEALDRLKSNAEPEGEEECAIEESTEELGSRPAKGHVLRKRLALGDVDGNKGDDEANEVGQLSYVS